MDGSGLTEHGTEDIATLLQREEGLVWVDVPALDQTAASIFRDVLRFGEESIESSSRLSLVPRFKRYENYVGLTIHSLDSQGHLLELDEFVGTNFLVTVHAAAHGIAEETVLRETARVRDRIARDGYRPSSPTELAIAIVEEIATWLETYLEEIAFRSGGLDRQMREGEVKDRQGFLEELNNTRHELLTVYNRASQTAEGARQMARAGEPVLGQDAAAFEPLATRFESLRKICENERDFANGVLEHYQSVVQTKMNIAMERVALIAYLLIPFTISTGLLGMQISARDGLNVTALVVVMVFTFVATYFTYRYTKRKGWW